MKNITSVVDSLTIAKTILLWILTVIGFSIIYFTLTFTTHQITYNGQPLANNIAGFGNSIYLSFVTATTIGYGEIVLTGLSKIFTVIEAIASILLFGIVITKLVQVKQEAIVQEIQELTVEESTNNTISGLYIFRNELKEIKEQLPRNKKSALKTYDNACENITYALTRFNNAKSIEHEDSEKALMRLSLITNSINFSLSKQVELLEEFNKHRTVWTKESTTATLEEVQKTIKTLYQQYDVIKANDELTLKVAEKLKDLDNTLTTLKKSLQMP